MRLTLAELIIIINKAEVNNPYPADIFVSGEGKAARNAWIRCCEDIKLAIFEHIGGFK